MCKLLPQYDSPELQDKKNLEFYGISEGAILFLSHRPQATVTVFVKTFTRKTLTCDVALDWDVLMLKHIIREKEGKKGILPGTPHKLMSFLQLIAILIDQQHLIYSEKQLQDTLTLSSYGIQNESTIQLVLRTLGGGAWKTLAYAIVYHDWDGDMASRFFTVIY